MSKNEYHSFGQKLAFHTAPTLLGIKCASLVSLSSAEFDLANNTREYLLSHFSIAEGKTALEKARINKQLYDALKSCGE